MGIINNKSITRRERGTQEDHIELHNIRDIRLMRTKNLEFGHHPAFHRRASMTFGNCSMRVSTRESNSTSAISIVT